MKLTQIKLKELIKEELKKIKEGSYYEDPTSPILDDVMMAIESQGGQMPISRLIAMGGPLFGIAGKSMQESKKKDKKT